MNKLLKSIFLVSVFILLSSGGFITSANTTTSFTTSPSLYVIIEDAFYCDLQQENIENDIFSIIYIEFESSFAINDLYMYVELILPSGTAYAYLYLLTFYFLYSTYIDMSMFDHAYEPGDYQLTVIIYFPDFTELKAAASKMIFDPPGSDSNEGDPPAPSLDARW